MFRGFSNVSLDSKGRLAIPSRYRERLMEEAGGRLVLTINPFDRSQSLYLYPEPEWEIIEKKLEELSDFDRRSRRVKQMMRGHTSDCKLDSHGRILVSGGLRDYAGLDKQVIVLGQGNKFEIWNKLTWEKQRDLWLNEVGDEQEASCAALQSLSL